MVSFLHKALAILLIISVLLVTGLWKVAVLLFILYLLIEGIYWLYLVLNDKNDNDYDDGKRE